MNNIHPHFIIAILLVLMTSCANYKVNYSESGKEWKQNKPPTDKTLEHRMYLIGDAGNAPMGGTTPVLANLKSRLAKESKNSSIVFLGDNIYPGGMPPKGEEADRTLSEYRLKIQMDALEAFKGKSYFIPGNHDWRRWGLKGLKREEQFIEKYMNRGIEDKDDWENYFLPDNGCAGPEVVELNDNLVLVIVDSQWWLADWDKEPSINDGCEVKNKFMFQFNLENILRKHRRKNVVVALHHPPYTYGPHGGASTIKEHIFPLTQAKDNLYIPLPIIGSVGAFLRGTIGSKQDNAHQTYKELVHAIMASAGKNGSFIFASGHEHNLQYIEKRNQTFIVSGAGSKTSPTKLGSDAHFTYGTKGYSYIDFYEGGEAWVHFLVPNKDGSEAQLVFRKKLKEKQMPSEDQIPTSFPIYEQGLDSIDMRVSKTNAGEIGIAHKIFLGTHHRDIYQQNYTFPVLDLGKFRGGMTPVKRGGGNQTNSLRLKDPEGKQFVMRSMTKDASRTLPFPFNKMTAAKFIAEDNFLSTHPFAPLAIPPLADAVGIYHTNPTLYFIPKQPTLGIYNDEYGGDVYLVEERPAGNWSGTGNFGDSKKIMGTPDVTEKIVDNHKHYIDGNFALRNRLFDIVIGDWDRHDDQWRWARFDMKDEEGHEGHEHKGKHKHRLYRPIPRDRDQAFSKYDGIMISFARLFMPFLRQLRIYSPNITNMKWITWSSRNFDRSFLNELDWEDWEEEVKLIQEQLTDETIDQAFETWPQVVQDLSADHIKKSIKARRDKLDEYARKFYQRLSRRADVYGTDKKEIFEIHREEDGIVEVKVWEVTKKDKVGHPIFVRKYSDEVTEEIHIYGIGDDDQFVVKGEVNTSILIRLIGGQGEDIFVDNSYVKKGSKRTYIYDDLRENTVDLGKEAADKRSKHREKNIYDRRASHYESNFFVPLPIIGVNPDDGFGIGMSAVWTTYTFKKEPFSALHNFALNYAFATKALKFDYQGDYPHAFGNLDFYLEGWWYNDAYAANFFDFGNETRNVREIDYYRTRQSQFHIFPALKKRFAGGAGNFKIGPMFEMRELEPTPGRILISELRTDENDEIYSEKTFAGARLNIEFLNLDNYVFPHKGIHFNTDLSYLGGVSNDGTGFVRLRSTLAFHQSLDSKENLVFASKFGFNHNFGDDYEFYHAPNLGGQESLRGYRFQRFYGQTAYWQNIDLRARLFSNYNNTLPFTFGLYAGFDYGRVWYDEEDSDTWHYNYGGGFWVAPVDVLTFTFGVFQPKEDFEEGPRFSLRLGMGF